MSENEINQIVSELRAKGAQWYPEMGEIRAVRTVGHTPKSDHYIYDLLVNFENGNERLAVKLYRATKGGHARTMAAAETAHLHSVWNLTKTEPLSGIPRPIGDFSALGAVVSEKLAGFPLQSLIMKAALLPGYAGLGVLQNAAAASGAWLCQFQKATARPAKPLDRDGFQSDIEKLCNKCKSVGLDDMSVSKILSTVGSILNQSREPLMNSAVLNEFTPLSVAVLDRGVGFSDFARMQEDGSTYTDSATFLASVEVLEKYPFCNRSITTEVQERFLDAYGATEEEREILQVVKMKILLSMFAAGRTVPESALRKKVMWANVMKKFIQAVADRSTPKAA